MLNKKTIIKLVSVILTAVIIISTVCTVAFASTSGSGSTKKVIQVWTNKTGSTPSITLTQTKGTYHWYTLGGTEKTSSIYGYYNVKVKAVSNIAGKKTNSKSFNKVFDGKTLKLSLQKDTYYEIIITENHDKVISKATNIFNGNVLALNPNTLGWKSPCKWKVSAKVNCGNCV